jgi:hypothetical protein
VEKKQTKDISGWYIPTMRYVSLWRGKQFRQDFSIDRVKGSAPPIVILHLDLSAEILHLDLSAEAE